MPIIICIVVLLYVDRRMLVVQKLGRVHFFFQTYLSRDVSIYLLIGLGERG
jgi:hypothetical protein